MKLAILLLCVQANLARKEDFLGDLNLEVDPCDNIWDYVCSNATKAAGAPFQLAQRRINRKVQEVLLNLKPEDAPTKKLQVVYQYLRKLADCFGQEEVLKTALVDLVTRILKQYSSNPYLAHLKILILTGIESKLFLMREEAFSLDRPNLTVIIEPGFQQEELLELTLEDKAEEESDLKDKKNLGVFPRRLMLEAFESFNWVLGRKMSTLPFVFRNPLIFDEIDHNPSAGIKIIKHHVMSEISMDFQEKEDSCLKLFHPGATNIMLRAVLDKENVTIDKILSLRKLFEELRWVFLEKIFNLEWMDAYSKNRAINKLMGMVPRIIAPPHIFQNSELEIEFQKLPSLLPNNTIWDVLLEFNINQWRLRFERLGRLIPVHFNRFLDDISFDTNAANDRPTNTINLGLGLLQLPLFHWEYPPLYLFAGLGSIIAHEIVHGFDTVGVMVDRRGMIDSWLLTPAHNTLQAKLNCFTEEIRDLSKGMMDLSAVNEIAADHEGLQLAFDAYFRNRNPSTMELEEAQSFLSFFVKRFCYPEEEEELYRDLWQKGEAYHPPNRLRVETTLRNSAEFARAFNCPLGSRMNPDREKCNLW